MRWNQNYELQNGDLEQVAGGDGSQWDGYDENNLVDMYAMHRNLLQRCWQPGISDFARRRFRRQALRMERQINSLAQHLLIKKNEELRELVKKLSGH